MNAKTNTKSSAQADSEMVTRLETMLQKQLELTRSEHGRAIEKLVGQTAPVLNEITSRKLLQKPEFATQRKNISKLYDEISIGIEAAKTGVTGEIDKIRKGRKSLRAYSSKSKVY